MSACLIFIALGILVLGMVMQIPQQRGYRPKSDLPPPTVAPPSPYRNASLAASKKATT